jgi:hypothetical protein
MASTLLLDSVGWDWVVDASGNIAVAAEPYAQAQDAASAIRLFLGELYYDTTKGVPYARILAQPPNIPLLKSYMVAAALTVPGVVSAVCFITSVTDRGVTGQVQITNAQGVVTAASIAPVVPPPLPPASGPSLDYSNPNNSQYLPGL